MSVAFGFVALALILDVAIRHDPISVDFHTYLAAAKVGVADGWSRVYDQGLVMFEQQMLAPGDRMQPFISPPTVAFMVAPLTKLPAGTAYVVWAVLTFVAFAIALALSGVSSGLAKWIAVLGALSPWWVMHAVNVGQVTPLVAAGMVVGWRLLRDRRDVLAGIALAAMLFKPNIVILVPLALAFAGRFRAFVAWAACAAVVLTAVALALGSSGVNAYLVQLQGTWPTGGDNLTLHGALGVTGVAAAALRLLIVGAVLATAYRFRQAPGLVVPLAIIGSLLVSPYLHGSDLCVLAAAGWMIWEERPTIGWRLCLAVSWVLASPFLYLRGDSPHLTQWPWLEIALLLGLVIAAWWPLTVWADSRTRAPA